MVHPVATLRAAFWTFCSVSTWVCAAIGVQTGDAYSIDWHELEQHSAACCSFILGTLIVFF